MTLQERNKWLLINKLEERAKSQGIVIKEGLLDKFINRIEKKTNDRTLKNDPKIQNLKAKYSDTEIKLIKILLNKYGEEVSDDIIKAFNLNPNTVRKYIEMNK